MPSVGNPSHRPLTGNARVLTFDALVERIMARPGEPRLVAVDGPGGAGKSTFSRRLARAAGEAPVVPTDDFASWDHPIDWWPRLFEQVIRPLASGRSGRYQRFDWSQGRLADWVTVPVAPIVVIEGVSSGRSEWRSHLSFLVWVETDRDERLRRGLERDGEDARPQWEEWMATEDHHFAVDGSRSHAQVLVDGNPGDSIDPEAAFVALEPERTEPEPPAGPSVS